MKTSIIIPNYNMFDTLKYCIDSICNQNLTKEQFKSIEVIVVDDGSDVKGLDMLYEIYKNAIESKGMMFNLVRSYKNKGRAYARNLGASVSSGEILVFIDADIVLHSTYLKETIVRHQFLDKIVLVGFKENISIKDPLLSKLSPKIRKPNIYKDFRFNKYVSKDWIGLYPVKTERTINCVKESNYFKDFGMGRVIGPFDLPCMVVSHNLSLKRKEFEKIGGFEVRFSKRWGFEDTYLGARLIANENYVIPLLSTGVFHIEVIDEESSGLKAKKYSDMKYNFKLYKNLIKKKCL